MKTTLLPAILLLSACAFADPDIADPAALSRDEENIEVDLGISMQFRYTASFAPGASDPVDDPAIGFSFRRLRGKVSAGVDDFKIRLQADGVNALLLDLSVDYSPAENWRIRLGQFKPAFNREQIVSSTRQLAVDRSSTGNSIGPVSGGRVQGVEVRWQGADDRVTATVSEGSGSINTEFASPLEGAGAALRFERLLMGESFKPFDAMTASPDTPESLLLGFAVWHQQLDSGGDRIAWTADLSYMNSGLSLTFIGVGHVAEDRNSGASPEPEHAYGGLVQGGVYVSDTIEPFARYEWATTSDARHPELSVLTAGVNWYIHGQALKFVADASVAFDGVGPVFNRDTDGLLETDGSDHRFVLRAQVQMLF